MLANEDKIVLQILLNSNADEALEKVAQWSESDWDAFIPLARKNLLSIRFDEALKKKGIKPSGNFSAFVQKEHASAQIVKSLITTLSEKCRKNDIEFVMTKAFQHYPDVGRDIDLFLSERNKDIDQTILESFKATSLSLDFGTWMGGKTAYDLAGCPYPLEIHHGRMGDLGEHNLFPSLFIKNRKEAEIDGIKTFVLAPEDQLLVQVIQRIYNHYSFRLSDVAKSFQLLKENLDWNYVFATARRIGVYGGLSCLLSYMDQIHESLFGKKIVPSEAERALSSGWGKVEFKDGIYRFPTANVLSRVYSRRFFSQILARNWAGVGRLSLLPVSAFLACFRSPIKFFRVLCNS